MVARDGGPPTAEPSAILAEDRQLLAEGAEAVRVRRVASPALVLGIGQRSVDELERSAGRLGLPILRRSSGGLALLLRPGDLAWTIVLPRDHRALSHGAPRAFDRLGAPVADALDALGLATRWSPPFQASSSYCLLGPRGSVLTADGRALGGAAQHLSARALLHHGLIVSSKNPALLEALFGLGHAATRRLLTSLEELRPERDDRRLAEEIGRRLAETFFGSPSSGLP